MTMILRMTLKAIFTRTSVTCASDVHFITIGFSVQAAREICKLKKEQEIVPKLRSILMSCLSQTKVTGAALGHKLLFFTPLFVFSEDYKSFINTKKTLKANRRHIKG